MKTYSQKWIDSWPHLSDDLIENSGFTRINDDRFDQVIIKANPNVKNEEVILAVRNTNYEKVTRIFLNYSDISERGEALKEALDRAYTAYKEL